MKKSGISTVLLLIFLNTTAQNWHLGINGGLSNYNGDLIESYYVVPQTNGHIGFSLYYELFDQLLIRTNLNYAKINGDDRYNSSEYLTRRNLRFESTILEIAATGEFHLFNLYNKRYSPYLFAGFALFYFNPYAQDSAGGKVYLKPLSTEGQGIYADRKPYKKIQPAIPAGIGIRFAINENIRLGLEAGFRKTFTDYLDDVSTTYPDAAELFNARGQLAVDYSYRTDELADGSPAFPSKGEQRGGSEYKDNYYFTALTLSFRLAERRKNLYRGNRKGFGCPMVPL